MLSRIPLQKDSNSKFAKYIPRQLMAHAGAVTSSKDGDIDILDYEILISAFEQLSRFQRTTSKDLLSMWKSLAHNALTRSLKSCRELVRPFDYCKRSIFIQCLTKSGPVVDTLKIFKGSAADETSFRTYMKIGHDLASATRGRPISILRPLLAWEVMITFS